MRLFVGNLAFSVTDKDIFDHFCAQGFKPFAVKLVTDRESGKSRGFSFVDIPDDLGSKAVQNLNGTLILGRGIKVSVAEDKRNQSPNSTPVKSRPDLVKPNFVYKAKDPIVSPKTQVSVTNAKVTPKYNDYIPPEPYVFNPPVFDFPVEKERTRRKDPSNKKRRRERNEDEDW